MGNRRKNSAFQVELAGGGSLARRKTALLPGGAFLFEDELAVCGAFTADVITCAAWLVEFYELAAGEIFFISGAERIRPRAKRFGVLYPPFSIVRPYFNNAAGHLVGIAATDPLPAELRAAPIVFDAACAAPPSGVEQALEILRASDKRQPVEANPNPSWLARRTKRLIDESYLVYPAIARIAARLGVTPEHLSRQFKRDYGMPPSAYLRQLRVADAPLLLARGAEIINVAQDVGYNDLSRFYKQFRKTTKTSPGACQRIMKPARA